MPDEWTGQTEDEQAWESLSSDLSAELDDMRRQRDEARAQRDALLEACQNLENDDGCRMPDSAWELIQEAVEAATGERKPSASELRAQAEGSVK